MNYLELLLSDARGIYIPRDFIDQDARRWTLYQDGNLWAVADDMPEQQRLEFFGEC